jgi:hypothetical protein
VIFGVVLQIAGWFRTKERDRSAGFEKKLKMRESTGRIFHGSGLSQA